MLTKKWYVNQSTQNQNLRPLRTPIDYTMLGRIFGGIRHKVGGREQRKLRATTQDNIRRGEGRIPQYAQPACTHRNDAPPFRFLAHRRPLPCCRPCPFPDNSDCSNFANFVLVCGLMLRRICFGVSHGGLQNAGRHLARRHDALGLQAGRCLHLVSALAEWESALRCICATCLLIMIIYGAVDHEHHA